MCVSYYAAALSEPTLLPANIKDTNAHKEDYLCIDFRIILNTCRAHLTTIHSETV